MTIEEKVANKSLDIDEVVQYYDEGCTLEFTATRDVHRILRDITSQLKKCNCEKCKKIIMDLGYEWEDK